MTPWVNIRNYDTKGKYHGLQNPWVNTTREYHNYDDKIEITIQLYSHFNIMIYFIYYHALCLC